jgi:hypothetical protein
VFSSAVDAATRSTRSGNDGKVGGRHHELLGVGAEVAVEPGHHAGDPGADGLAHAGAGGDDGAGASPSPGGPLRLADQPISP